ncbi:GNAT family N-acetyltransferase [Rubellimicrobium roseum]|uniref:GNAT family N-acetyltransferase n=1 Tax=Rubellimicrobium roseum TaxID=687525 RepID=A0A5C4N7U6_9RHOB|nr:GNAT family N-acetyltransferase [Rubellimicrobium roseum]TNC67215.1 GNAT family N-acetyltransferase [Rubellimicrobium roseum]
MQAEAPRLVRMGPEHLDGAMALSLAEGWPHRLEDWALILSQSEGVVAIDGQQVVATAIAIPFGPVATLGMILVDRRLRGRGLGRRVVEHAMAQLAPREWRLVATQEGLPLYRKLGFEPCGEVQQHQGLARAAPGHLPADWAGNADAPDLAALDEAATGMDRSWLMEALLRDGRALIQRERGEVVAFAAHRRFGRGDLVGPLVARSETEAHAMLGMLLNVSADRFLRVDLTDEGIGLSPFLIEHGLEPVGTGTMMRRGRAQPIRGAHRRFALVAQALG